VKKRRLLRISDARYDGVNFLDLGNATPESLLLHMRRNELKKKTDKKENKSVFLLDWTSNTNDFN